MNRCFLAVAVVCAGLGVRAYAQIGPDVIVADLQDTAKWAQLGGITAFSIATTSCNVGDVPLDWYYYNNRHPVISQNLYRLKDGQFEQIGMSWLKHGFCAISLDLCYNDCQATECETLGVHCSDPYSASLNGEQRNLGPSSLVNPVTGDFPYPYEAPPIRNSLSRRLQVDNDDLNPNMNGGAMYFAESQYVTPDDAMADNNNNNTSYRRVQVYGTDPDYTLGFLTGHPTQRTKPAILAWEDFQPGVKVRVVDIDDDGRFMVGYRASDNGDGTWHYEYAVHNMNSYQAAQSFSIPIPPGVNVTQKGFHDVDHHSGEGENGGEYSGKDWSVRVRDGRITWETEEFSNNINANALRWGSLFNFRFDADAPPEAAEATIELFKPGTVSSATTTVLGPAGGGAVPCSVVKKFRARCKDGTNKIKAKVVLKGQDYDGYTMVIGVDGDPHDVTVKGKKAKLSVPVSSGSHTVTLDDPADCKSPVDVVCN